MVIDQSDRGIFKKIAYPPGLHKPEFVHKNISGKLIKRIHFIRFNEQVYKPDHIHGGLR